MRALSIRQPWAYLIAHGIKPVENRTWPTNVRGPVLIHAGLRIDAEGIEWIRENMPEVELPEYYPVGGIVGVARLTDCVTDHPSPWFFGPYGFVFADARPLAATPTRGKLGFFDVPMEVQA